MLDTYLGYNHVKGIDGGCKTKGDMRVTVDNTVTRSNPPDIAVEAEMERIDKLRRK